MKHLFLLKLKSQKVASVSAFVCVVVLGISSATNPTSAQNSCTALPNHGTLTSKLKSVVAGG
jgi:hypothetical protein